ncbi:uncharacterized protein LOC131618962 [Vicia villosa]|uniref:uncharacterized protein LOC131618962 n=1 Tax=Vicia villosa TaxID=3911 RepID=UPI00273B0D73|nr:uncharacterized protein LOC131618962 [Vicia villosa]
MVTLMSSFDSIPKESMITLSGQEGSNSQLSTQNSENQQLTPVQKLLSKAVIMPIGDSIKLRTVCFQVVCNLLLHFVRLLEKLKCWWPLRMASIIVVAMLAHVLGVVTDLHLSVRLAISLRQRFLGIRLRLKLLMQGIAVTFYFETESAGIHDPLEFPLALDHMLDRKMDFKIKWKPRWKNASVVMLLRNDPFVKELADQLDTDEMKQPGVEATGTVLTEPHFVFDLDVTSTHSTNPITPTSKRQFPGSLRESTTSDATCDGELSSNKLKKIIKLEKID